MMPYAEQMLIIIFHYGIMNNAFYPDRQSYLVISDRQSPTQ